MSFHFSTVTVEGDATLLADVDSFVKSEQSRVEGFCPNGTSRTAGSIAFTLMECGDGDLELAKELAMRWPHAIIRCVSSIDSCDTPMVHEYIWENGVSRLLNHFSESQRPFTDDEDGVEEAPHVMWYVRDGEPITHPPYWESARVSNPDPDPDPDTLLNLDIPSFEDQM